MHDFQDTLKEIDEKDLEGLITEIVETGFAFAPYVWKNPEDGQWKICDAHQRKKALLALEARGYTIPKLQTIEVLARDRIEAKRRVLQASSQYGRMTVQGLANFSQLAGIKFESLGSFRFPEVKMSSVQAHLRAQSEPSNDEDEVAEPPKIPRTKRGELWLLGAHRLLCGDSTSEEDVARLMAGEKAEITFTSPPYNLGVAAKLSGNTHIGKAGNAYGTVGYDDNKSEGEWLHLVRQATEQSLKHSRYAFWNIQFLAGNRTALPAFWAGFSARSCDVLIWDKGHAPPQQAERVLNSRFEFIFVFTSDEKPCRAIRTAPVFRGTIDNVLELPPQRKNEFAAIHGATFPVALPEWFITRFSTESVLDLFSGSGSTLIACEKTQRRCFGMEIAPEYCDVILDRWARFTGRQPVREDGYAWPMPDETPRT